MHLVSSFFQVLKAGNDALHHTPGAHRQGGVFQHHILTGNALPRGSELNGPFERLVQRLTTVEVQGQPAMTLRRDTILADRISNNKHTAFIITFQQ